MSGVLAHRRPIFHCRYPAGARGDRNAATTVPPYAVGTAAREDARRAAAHGDVMTNAEPLADLRGRRS